MGFFMDVTQPFNAVVCIDLGCRKTAVAQQLFHGIQFRTIAGEMGSKTVPQHVRAFFVGSGHQRQVFFHNIIDLTGCMRFLFGGQQQLGKYRLRENCGLLYLKSPDLVYKLLV